MDPLPTKLEDKALVGDQYIVYAESHLACNIRYGVDDLCDQTKGRKNTDTYAGCELRPELLRPGVRQESFRPLIVSLDTEGEVATLQVGTRYYAKKSSSTCAASW